MKTLLMKLLCLWLAVVVQVPTLAVAADALKPESAIQIYAGKDEAGNKIWEEALTGPQDFRLNRLEGEEIPVMRRHLTECLAAKDNCDEVVVYVPAKPTLWQTRAGGCIIEFTLTAAVVAAFMAGHKAGSK